MPIMKKKFISGVENRYIITRDKNSGVMQVSLILEDYPEVEIIDRLDDSTVLVEMTENELKELSNDHPELEIELNEFYQLM